MHSDSAELDSRDQAMTERTRLGEEIRRLRKARSKTLAEIASATGRSISFISQLERGRADIPISDLKRIALSLGVPVSWFLMSEQQPQAEAGRVVRANGRRRLGSVTGGLIEELLSPSIGGEFEMYLSTIAAKTAFEYPVARETEEEGYLISGQLDLWINGDHFSLQAGDSFRIVREPYRWENTGETEATLVWIIAPPVF